MCALGFPHRRFSVLNPTSKAYSFKWRCKDTGGSQFCCLTPCGTIMPGKKVEVRMETQTVKSLHMVVLSYYISLPKSFSEFVVCFTSSHPFLFYCTVNLFSNFAFLFSIPFLFHFPHLPMSHFVTTNLILSLPFNLIPFLFSQYHQIVAEPI